MTQLRQTDTGWKRQFVPQSWSGHMVSMSRLVFEDSLRRVKRDLSRKYSRKWILRVIRSTFYAVDGKRHHQLRMKRLILKHLDQKSNGLNHWHNCLSFMKHLLIITPIFERIKVKCRKEEREHPSQLDSDQPWACFSTSLDSISSS